MQADMALETTKKLDTMKLAELQLKQHEIHDLGVTMAEMEQERLFGEARQQETKAQLQRQWAEQIAEQRAQRMSERAVFREDGATTMLIGQMNTNPNKPRKPTPSQGHVGEPVKMFFDHV